MKSLVLLNFKNYPEALGNKALKLAKKVAKVKKADYQIALAPSMLTIKEIARKVSLPIFAQHTDHVTSGAHTGRICAEELRLIGVKGTLLNHSERKIPFNHLKEIVKLCKEKKLQVIICASNLTEIRKVIDFDPDYLAYEPKELIGGDLSITTAKPELLLEAIEMVKETNPRTKFLCGAGIRSKEDIGNALLLGANGVLISHAVVRSKNPKQFLESILL